MLNSERSFVWSILLGCVEFFYSAPAVATAQTIPPAVSSGVVTTEFLRDLAGKLKQDLSNGALVLADVHVIQLRIALKGLSDERLSSSVTSLEQMTDADDVDPSLTKGLLPTVDKALAELDKPHSGEAQRYVETLAIQIHKQHELFTKRRAVSGGEVVDGDDYYPLSEQLQDSLRRGDINAAVAAATKLETEIQDLLGKKQVVPLRFRNLYNINDALGRAALLRQDYLSACDYLLKASEAGGGDPAMTTFGPDFWLAQALLNKGYRDVVELFLRQCQAFWTRDVLTQYIETLERGGTPDFTKNIFSNQPIKAE